MRGADVPQTTTFSYVSVVDRIPADPPPRDIQALVSPKAVPYGVYDL